MNSNLRFSLGKAPFIRKADNGGDTATIMRDFIIGLLPLVLFAWVKNGLLPMINNDCGVWEMLYPLIFCILGGVFTYAIEYVYYFLTKKEIKFTKASLFETHKKVMNSFAVIPGLILAMIMPLNTPIWVLFVSSLFATLVGKLLFGGFGCNIFNPALVGYLFFAVSYQGLTSFMNPSELDTIISGATPLGNAHSNILASGNELIGAYGNVWNFLLGTIPGSIAETSALLCLVSFAWLTYRKVINWKIPVVYVATVFLLTYLVPVVDGRPGDLLYPLFHTLSGGLLFGAVFMATEPVTSPKTPNGKVIYALGLGVLTVLMRLKSNAPEGVATSIMAMNLFSILIDTICSRVRAQRNLKKTLITYFAVGLILVLLSVYPISAATANKVDGGQNFEAQTQDELYKYDIRIDRVDFEVYTDRFGNITKVTNEEYASGEGLATVQELVKDNLELGYISKTEKVGDKYLVNVNYLSNVTYNRTFTLYCEFDLNYRLTNCYVKMLADGGDYNEGYNLPYANYNGPLVEVVLPPEIIKHQNSLQNVHTITQATTTSVSLIDSAKIAINYMKDVKSGNITFQDGFTVEVK